MATQKKAKYASLVARLRGAGYAVELFVVMIGSRGGITTSAAGVLASFGLSPEAAKAVLRRLHVEACNWLMCPPVQEQSARQQIGCRPHLKKGFASGES